MPTINKHTWRFVTRKQMIRGSSKTPHHLETITNKATNFSKHSGFLAFLHFSISGHDLVFDVSINVRKSKSDEFNDRWLRSDKTNKRIDMFASKIRLTFVGCSACWSFLDVARDLDGSSLSGRSAWSRLVRVFTILLPSLVSPTCLVHHTISTTTPGH